MKITKEIKLLEHNGKNYFTVRQFAELTNRSEKAVYALIKKGNRLRKLNAIMIVKRTLIPEEELTEFIFTGPGKQPYSDAYRFDKEGKQYPVDKEDVNVK